MHHFRIFAFEKYRDLETWVSVIQHHQKSQQSTDHTRLQSAACQRMGWLSDLSSCLRDWMGPKRTQGS